MQRTVYNPSVIIFFGLMLCLVLSACDNGQSNGTDDSSTTEETERSPSNDGDAADEQQPDEAAWQEALTAPEPAESIEDVFAYPAGKFAGMDLQNNEEDMQKVMETFSELPKLGEDASEEKMNAYWRKMLSLFHEDFPGYGDILEDMKVKGFGSPDIEDDRYQFKEHLNVEVVLDASGSMGAYIGNKTRMQLAKETIRSFASSLPEEARVSLRVYGHKGTGSESDKKMSCNSTELVYQLQKYKAKKFKKALNKFDPAGWTPIALALKEAKKDLSDYPSKNNTNIIYLVSDGIPTCGGDPVKAAKNLAKSNINPIVNVIGYETGQKEQKQLQKIAKAADGTYTTVNNQEQFQEELNKAQQIAEQWQEWKKEAQQQASHHHFVQGFDILDYTNTFFDKGWLQDTNIMYAMGELQEEGYISRDAYQYLNQKRNAYFQSIKQYWHELEAKLNEINDESFKEMKQDIEEKYEQNVDQ